MRTGWAGSREERLGRSQAMTPSIRMRTRRLSPSQQPTRAVKNLYSGWRSKVTWLERTIAWYEAKSAYAKETVELSPRTMCIRAGGCPCTNAT